MGALLLNKVKSAGISVWLGIAAAILVIIAVAMAATGNALTSNTSLGADAVAVGVVGIVFSLAAFWFRFNFWQLIPAILYTVTLGLTIKSGINVLMDRFNDVVYSGGNFDMVVTYLALLGAACILCIAACFINPTRAEN